MRAAAALRLALMVDPALRVVDDLLKNKKHPIQQRLAAAKEVFERNGVLSNNSIGVSEVPVWLRVSLAHEMSAPGASRSRV